MGAFCGTTRVARAAYDRTRVDPRTRSAVLHQRRPDRHPARPAARSGFAVASLVAALIATGLATPRAADAAGPRDGAPIRGLAVAVDPSEARPPAGNLQIPAYPRLGWSTGGTAEPGRAPTQPSEPSRPSRPSEPSEPGAADAAADEIAPAAAPDSGPGVVVGNAFAGLTDASNNTSIDACDNLAQRPCGEPGDPWVAASPAHVVQVTNWRVRVTDHTGDNRSGDSTRDWFAIPELVAGRTPFDTDARVVWDQRHGRWVASNVAYDCAFGSIVTVMVSRAADGSPFPLGPRAGGWSRYRLAFPGELLDFPTLGTSTDHIAVGANRYPVSCAATGDGSLGIQPIIGRFDRASLFVFDWTAILAGQDGDSIPFVDMAPVLDPTGDRRPFGYAPARWTPNDAYPGTSDRLQVVVSARAATTDPLPLAVGYASLVGAVGTDPASQTISTPPLALVGDVALALPAAPRDPGGTLDQAVDFRITDAVWRRTGSAGAGRLAFASTVAAASGRPQARLIELATPRTAGAPANLAQLLPVEPAAGFTDTFMPGVAYANDGTLWAVYSQSGPAATIGTWARRQLTADRADSPGAAAFSRGSARVTVGLEPYAGINRRWGDSVGVAPDPRPGNQGSVWQANQFADTLEGWATYVARLDDDVAGPAVPASGQRFRRATGVTATTVSLEFWWTPAVDAGSGVAQHLVEQRIGDAWVALAPVSPAVTYAVATARIGTPTQFRVTAFDNAGNRGPTRTGPTVTARIVEPRAANGVTFTRTWTRVACSTCLFPKLRTTRRAGATATLTTTARAVAWVAVVGPRRGSARIWADGASRGVVGTLAATRRSGRVRATASWGSLTRHRFTVQVLGTPGRPRIDLEAFLVLR